MNKISTLILWVINLFEDRTQDPIPKLNRASRRAGLSVGRRCKKLPDAPEYHSEYPGTKN